jgi:predicted ATP-binding protein involved in virulence
MVTMNTADQAIPPPKSWEQFEELCLALFRAVWQDATAQKNGRQGQQQLGVDIVGVNHAQDGGNWGVQCVFIPDGQSVSIAKITQDLAKADQFRPKLAGLIVATSSLADGRVLQHCKISSNERAVQRLFPVLVYDWAQLQTLLRANPQVAKLFYPDLFAMPGLSAGVKVLAHQAGDILHEALGGGDTASLFAMQDQADRLAQEGDLRGAWAVTEKALSTSQRLLGETHPLVLQIKENLAGYLEADGAFTAAQALRNEVLAVRHAQNGASQNQAPNTPSRFVLMQPEELLGNVDQAQYRTWHRTWLQSVTLTEFRCFERLEIALSEQLTVFIAPNGAGKTTVLDAIALAMGQFVQCFQNGTAPPLRKSDARLCPTNLALDLGTMEPRYPVVIAAQGEVDGKPFAWQYSQQSVNAKPVAEGKSPVADLGSAMQQAVGQDQPVVLPLVAYYGTKRLQKKEDLAAGASIAQFESGFFSRTAGYKDCLDSAADYKEFEQWFAYAASVNEGIAERRQVPPAKGEADSDSAPKAEVGFAPLIQSVCHAVDECLAISGWKNLHLSRKSRRLVMDHPRQGELPISQLSDGVRNMVALVADIAQRAVRLNPQFGSDAARKTPGLVLIDEVDLHLHPEWQQTVLTNLLAAFPMLQFVVTTHSPQVLSSVQPECIRQIEWDGDSAHLRQPEFSLGAESPQLLQDLQGVNPRPQHLPIVKKLNDYLQLIGQDQWDSKEALALRAELDEWSHGDEPSLTKADIDIRLREFRRSRK